MTDDTKNAKHAGSNGFDDWKYSEKAMSWYGWGSPVGLSLFLLSTVASAALVIHLLQVVGVVR